MPKFTKDSDFQRWIDAISRSDAETGKPRACQQAIDLLRERGRVSMVEGAASLPLNEPGWHAWALGHWGREMDIATRLAFIGNITDPMTAFTVYLRLPFLTDEEDRVLEATFRGKLPRAERELADGVIVRVKER